MSHINRAAIVIKPAQPCLDWINRQSPGDSPGTFQKWFTIEVHSAVVDLDGGEFEVVED